MTTKRICPEKQEDATKVIFSGTIFKREDKEPFVRSAFSIEGGQECTEDERKIKCHECGAWMVQITPRHLKPHGLSSRQYKIKHQLPLQCPLASPARRAFFSNVSKSRHQNPDYHEKAVEALARSADQAGDGRRRTAKQRDRRMAFTAVMNTRMNCKAQLTVRLTNLASKLGHTPTAAEIWAGDEHGHIEHKTIEWAFQMTVAEALRAIGLVPNRSGVTVRMHDIPRQILQLRGQGLSFKEIAERLSVCPHTASKYSTPPKMLKGEEIWR